MQKTRISPQLCYSRIVLSYSPERKGQGGVVHTRGKMN